MRTHIAIDRINKCVRILLCNLYVYTFEKIVYNKKERGDDMPITESQRKAAYDYKKKNIKRVPLDMQKTEYEKLLQEASKAGLTVNGYIKIAISEKIERDRSEQ